MERAYDENMNAGQRIATIASLGGFLLSGFSAPAQADSIGFNAEIHQIGTHNPETQINWTDVTLPNGFVVANSYIQLTSSFNVASGGIQIYTDNLAPDAAPFNYIGPVNSSSPPPSGLVDTVTRQTRLPMAWTIRSGVLPPPAQDPNAGGFVWFYMLDKSQVNSPPYNTSAFEDGIPYNTIVNNRCLTRQDVCIHYAQSPTEFGFAPQPHHIFFEADFSTAMTPRTYRTNALRLEAFSQ
jgi:hypothetical protein